MGDSDAPSTENTNESREPASCDISKPSIDILKAAKSSENISITDKIESSANINVETTLKSSATRGTAQIVTVEELKNEVVGENIKNESDKGENEVKLKEKAALKNKNDIFGANADVNTNPEPAIIFSVGGAPSKAIHKTMSINSDRTSSSSDTIKSNMSRKSHYRNPLTGIGVSSNDEFKNKPSKRKDGNPLLGVGYKDDDQFFNTPPPTRIPPGGHSKGLW